MTKIADPSAIAVDRARYSIVAIVFHWVTAATIAVQVLTAGRLLGVL